MWAYVARTWYRSDTSTRLRMVALLLITAAIGIGVLWIIQSGSYLVLWRLIGVVLLIGGGRVLVRDARYVLGGQRTTGTVEKVVPMGGGENYTERATIAYRDSAGHVRHDQYTCRATSYQVGAEVPVFYDPRRPGSIRLGQAAELWETPVIFIGIGIGITVITHPWTLLHGQ